MVNNWSEEIAIYSVFVNHLYKSETVECLRVYTDEISEVQSKFIDSS